MVSFLTSFGTRLSSAWHSSGSRPSSFPSLVHEMLDPSKLVYNPDELLETVMNPDLLSFQTRSLFSEFNCRLYSDPLLFIELLHWHDMDTDLHNHNFTGVLYQLEGEALDVTYDFKKRGPSHIEGYEQGNMSVTSVEVLTGEHTPSKDIYLKGYNHAVAHTGKPTVSLIIRTQPIHGVSQSIFFPPSLKITYTLTMSDIKFIRLFRYVNKFDQTTPLLRLYIPSLFSFPNRLMSLLARLADVFKDEDLTCLNDILVSHGCDMTREVHTSFVSFLAYRKALLLKSQTEGDKEHSVSLACKALSYGNTSFYNRIRTDVQSQRK